MEQETNINNIQNFALFALAFGVLLTVSAIISGASLLIALGRGILIHTIQDIRANVVRFIFSFIVPLIGGIILIFAGLKLTRIDRHMLKKDMVRSSRRKKARQKEQMLNVFLKGEEKKIMEMLKNEPKGTIQSDIVIRTGYSKVKVHRLLKSLEAKGLIKRGRLGITNRVLINNGN